ncbi:hypothetical protein JI666_04060 [Bacillus sp. NTK071]|uniref:hypothetical protein n=1 Tax=Bacillus sp. NTK071 TaxID=2802175 RepID=UPI001A8FB278|nr:hypothetical protein [Bacillus sp. NTK071]MBN8207917.1 hypothetical protein [Bacillus sp. NTK071]
MGIFRGIITLFIIIMIGSLLNELNTIFFAVYISTAFSIYIYFFFYKQFYFPWSFIGPSLFFIGKLLYIYWENEAVPSISLFLTFLLVYFAPKKD